MRKLEGRETITLVVKSDDYLRYRRLCKKHGIKQIDMFSILLDKKLNKLEYAFTILSQVMAELDIARGELYKASEKINIILSDSDLPQTIPLWDIVKKGEK